tara:strand:+ start:158 stop:568 length:411 start_codon:yes stop_codon:yes gene_type:complete
MKKHNSLLLVVSAALIKDEKVLFQQRSADKSMPFLWELPGGKIKANESPEIALCRELYEELDVIIDKLLPLTFVSHSYPGFHLLMPVYICRKWEGSIKSKENQIIQFFNKEELGKINMLKADKLLIQPLKKILTKS